MTPSWCLKAIGEHDQLIFKVYIEENNKKIEFFLYFEVPKIFTKTKILAENNLNEQEEGEENKNIVL